MGTVLNHHLGKNLEYLFAELNRIELKLRLQALQARSRDSYWDRDELRGLYVSSRELSALITDGLIEDQDTTLHSTTDPNYKALLGILGQLEEQIETRKAENPYCHSVSRLERLVSMFHLTAFEKDAILLSMLPELDLKSQRLFGYIQDDVTRRKPTVALSLDLLCPSLYERLSGRQAFSPQGTLLRYQLVNLNDDTPIRPAPLLAKSLTIDDRICNYLLGFDEIESSLLLFTHRIAPRITFQDIILSDDIKDRLLRFIGARKEKSHHITWYFYGARGAGKRSTAEAICYKLGVTLLVADTNLILQTSLPFDTAVQLLCREAMLQDAIIYWDNFDVLFNDGLSAKLMIAVEHIRNHPGTTFIAGNEPWNINNDWQRRTFIPVAFPVPDYSQREQLWRHYLDGQVKETKDIIGSLAGKFKLNGGQIRGAIDIARNSSLWRDGGIVTVDDLNHACRQKSNKKLIELARKVEPRYIWSDIVLPRDQLEQLKDICNYVTYRHRVYSEWGFHHKLSLGKGLNILFAGPSGTGKTMAAEIIANELGLDLYKIDLAMVVSKYIGETEKNLDRIFKEARDSNGILFFDEADAIFGKRSEVRDSHDRYANIEIAYLLQKMEQYQGIVILATNLRKNIDEAFARRMHFSMEFPLPEEDDRHRIWQKAFPDAAPLADDLDLAFMARQFRITGGNIKNIALSAAFLAAESGGPIDMEKLIRATKREYQKTGRLCTEGDFARYFEMVKG